MILDDDKENDETYSDKANKNDDHVNEDVEYNDYDEDDQQLGESDNHDESDEDDALIGLEYEFVTAVRMILVVMIITEFIKTIRITHMLKLRIFLSMVILISKRHKFLHLFPVHVLPNSLAGVYRSRALPNFYQLHPSLFRFFIHRSR